VEGTESAPWWRVEHVGSEVHFLWPLVLSLFDVVMAEDDQGSFTVLGYTVSWALKDSVGLVCRLLWENLCVCLKEYMCVYMCSYLCIYLCGRLYVCLHVGVRVMCVCVYMCIPVRACVNVCLCALTAHIEPDHLHLSVLHARFHLNKDFSLA
jgi:hypothetical protein